MIRRLPNREAPRCVAPLDDTEGRDLSEIRLCGQPAVTERLVGADGGAGIDAVWCPLCAEHVADLDAERCTETQG